MDPDYNFRHIGFIRQPRSACRVSPALHGDACACAAGSVLRLRTFSTESPKAIKTLTLFPKEFAKALNKISA